MPKRRLEFEEKVLATLPRQSGHVDVIESRAVLHGGGLAPPSMVLRHYITDRHGEQRKQLITLRRVELRQLIAAAESMLASGAVEDQ